MQSSVPSRTYSHLALIHTLTKLYKNLSNNIINRDFSHVLSQCLHSALTVLQCDLAQS